jgi:hypothetical protein
MSYRQLAFSAAFLAAAVAVPAEAQDPAKPVSANDSTVADSAAGKPAKKSRFGGLVNKAKAVAGNKTVQAAAKNVGCTVVPGAAVASAVTGQGPCANTGIAGALMSPGGTAGAGGVKGAATGAVTGAITGALGGKAAGLMGASGAVGIPNAASVSAMQEMMRKSGALGGMSNDAATLLVQQVLIQSAATNGMSSAASAATIQQMLNANGALKGLTPAQANALVQQILIQSAAMAAMQSAAGAKR